MCNSPVLGTFTLIACTELGFLFAGLNLGVHILTVWYSHLLWVTYFFNAADSQVSCVLISRDIAHLAKYTIRL